MPNILTKLTETQWFDSMMAFLSGEGVPITTWVGKRHPGLAWTKFISRALENFDRFGFELESSLFLTSAFGQGLIKFARSQYQIEPFAPQTQIARFLLRSIQGSPDSTYAAGDVVVGQVGGALEWVNAEPFFLKGGAQAVVLWQAREAGAKYNIPANSALELKTTIVGASVSNPPSGAATTVGVGNASLILFAAQAGVTFELIDPGANNQPLVVNGNIITKVAIISLPTDGAGALTMTSKQLSDELTAIIANGSFAIDPLLLATNYGGTGGGVVQATAAPVALEWNGGYTQTAGADAEDPESLKRRMLTRFMTLGGWAGDGAPPAPVSTDEALEFWARQPPAGAARSVVTGVRVLSNFLNGAPSGKDITVLVWGVNGALSASELAAVNGNFYNGRKFSLGSDLTTVTVNNTTVVLSGQVDVDSTAGYTKAEVLAAIATRITAYQQNPRAIFPGVTLYPNILEARIADSLADGIIKNVTLTNPTLPLTNAYDDWPLLDISGLAVNLV